MSGCCDHILSALEMPKVQPRQQDGSVVPPTECGHGLCFADKRNNMKWCHFMGSRWGVTNGVLCTFLWRIRSEALSSPTIPSVLLDSIRDLGSEAMKSRTAWLSHGAGGWVSPSYPGTWPTLCPVRWFLKVVCEATYLMLNIFFFLLIIECVV